MERLRNLPTVVTHPPMTRREVLQRTGMGCGALALSSLVNGSCLTSSAANGLDFSRPLSPRLPHFAPRAKAVIWLVMNGGQSQIDTWDYKPELQRRHGQTLSTADPRTGFFKTTGKLLKSPFRFTQAGESGTWVSEIFPHIRQHVDKMAFVHSCYTESNNHSPALFQMNTGLNRMGFPCVGSWVTYGLGSQNENMPGFVVMTDALGRGLPKGLAQNWGAGFLPSVFQGVRLKDQGPPIDNLGRLGGQTAAEQRSFLDALSVLNHRHKQRFEGESELSTRIQSFELAYRMQMSAPGILDVNQETEFTRNAYGLDNEKCAHFGKQCLLARRMIEQNVRFVQIYSGGTSNRQSWDGHVDIRKNHSQFSREVDQPIAALIADLDARGLLDSTLIVCGGEFGRTSDAQGESGQAIGRDHNPHAMTMWFAGAGVKGGMHYGATDEVGYKAVENRVRIHDIHATILHLLGMNHEQLTYRFNGRDYRLTDVHGRILQEIIA